MEVFVCNCTDCRKITASMFASNIIVKDEYVKHLRGLENLKTFSQSTTIESGKHMTNYFCQTCGTLLYRVSEKNPGFKILRLGTVDDFNLAEVRILGVSWVFPSYFFLIPRSAHHCRVDASTFHSRVEISVAAWRC